MGDTPQKTPYSPYANSTGTNNSPTLDAAVTAYDEKKSNTNALSVEEKQALFRSQIENRSSANKTGNNNLTTSVGNIDDPTSPQYNFRLRTRNQGKTNDDTQKKSLDMVWFIIALLIAILIDLMSIGINFLIGIGGVISSALLMPMGIGILWYIHMINGVEFSRKISARFAVAGIIELIPVLNALPALTALVVLNKIAPIVEDKIQNSNLPIKDILPKK